MKSAPYTFYFLLPLVSEDHVLCCFALPPFPRGETETVACQRCSPGHETIKAVRSQRPSLVHSIVATSINTAPQRGEGCLADVLSSDVRPCPP